MFHKLGNKFKLKLDGKYLLVSMEEYSYLDKLDTPTRQRLQSEISSLLTKCWGSFLLDFIDHGPPPKFHTPTLYN